MEQAREAYLCLGDVEDEGAVGVGRLDLGHVGALWQAHAALHECRGPLHPLQYTVLLRRHH